MDQFTTLPQTEHFRKINLSGEWNFALQTELPSEEILTGSGFACPDTIALPSTISQEGKAPLTEERSSGYLTDPRSFTGCCIYQKQIPFVPSPSREVYLKLEKTRVSTLYFNGQKVGRFDSLCAPHIYRVTEYLRPDHQEITLVIDNLTCPVPGGHMTSPDTQTNWLGILGEISLSETPVQCLQNLRIYPDYRAKTIRLTGQLSAKTLSVRLTVQKLQKPADGSYPDLSEDFWEDLLSLDPITLAPEENDQISYTLSLPEAPLWSEHTPGLLRLVIDYADSDFTQTVPFALREYSVSGSSLYVNDTRIYLRGKHDGMLFPLTGAAPTDLASWMKVMGTAKEYGINHYRFHTCCPPEAAFYAADLLGIYLSPELPFWGTVEEERNPAQDYLVQEGFRILDAFGNHPSFFGFSLGNELWGSQKRLDQILADYKAYDNRHLYTQGSNNFQFVPAVLEHEDYFVGVRFSKERLFRGSYAMCDAPLGHIQTQAPNTGYTYDEHIRPGSTASRFSDSVAVPGTECAPNACTDPSKAGLSDAPAGGKTMEIQYGTGVKTVTLTDSAEFIPHVPVISHEIGQYFMYPDFHEIEKYTGVLKPYNFEIFQERLQAAGLIALSEDYFRASGRFAADCYKMELETALRSKELSGFQLLDLQDFTGQGTALVGVLNSFMESKGILSPEQWRCFCNDRVLLGCLDSFVLEGGKELSVPIKFFTYTGKPEENVCVTATLYQEGTPIQSCRLSTAALAGTASHTPMKDGVYDLGTCAFSLPNSTLPCKLTLRLELENDPKIYNSYDVWIYPGAQESAVCALDASEAPARSLNPSALEALQKTVLSTTWEEAKKELARGKNVLFLPRITAPANPPVKGSKPHFVAGTYCTDFWNYPMFRSISESVERAWPVGTLGILTDPDHPALKDFPCEFYSTPQWYDIVTDAPVAILDDTALSPIVRTIDNCERNHNLGLIWETKTGGGNLLVCTSPLDLRMDSPACRQLFKSLMTYLASDAFAPDTQVDLNRLDRLFTADL